MTKKIVSVSPLRLDRDSRSYRAAMSFQRFGYEIVAVEGQASAFGTRPPPFPLIRLYGRAGDDGNSSGNGSAKGRGVVRRLLAGLVWESGTFLWFVFQVFVINVVFGLARVPRADLYYLHEYRLFPMVYVLAKRSRAKILYDAHDFYPGVHSDDDLTVFWRGVFQPFLVWLEGLCLRHVDGMVTTSQPMADLYKDTFGIDAAVTRSCHDSRIEAETEKDIVKTIGLAKGDFLLVCVANSKLGQDVEVALDAMIGLPAHIHLAFLGAGYERYASKISARSLEKRVHLLGVVCVDEVVPFIRTADAAIILYYPRSLNYHLTLPNGFFHSIAARLPLLYPGLGCIKEVAQCYEIGFEINPRDPDSIRQGIKELMERMAGPNAFKDGLEAASRENTWQAEEAVLKGVVAAVFDE